MSGAHVVHNTAVLIISPLKIHTNIVALTQSLEGRE